MATRDEVRAELVRSRGFIRGAETQLTKAIAAFDALEEAPPVVPDPVDPPVDPDPVEPPPVDPPPPSGNTLFASSWASGTVKDTFDQVKSGAILSVVPGAPLGFSTPNVLRVENNGESQWGFVQKTLPTLPSVWTLAFDVRVDRADGFTFHSVKCGFQTLAIQFFGIEHPTGSTYRPRLKFASQTGLAGYGFAPPALQQGRVYRLVYRVEHYDPANPNRIRVYPYAYAADGTLVAGPDQWADVDDGRRTVSSLYAAGGYATVAFDQERDFHMGYEGTGGNNDTDADWYFGRVEIS